MSVKIIETCYRDEGDETSEIEFANLHIAMKFLKFLPNQFKYELKKKMETVLYFNGANRKFEIVKVDDKK